MYKVVKQSRAIQCVIVLLALFAMMTVYPLRLWKETIPSVSNQKIAGSSDSVGEDYMLQRFIAQYDHLATINLYVADFNNGWSYDERIDSFIFRMLDSDMEIMFEQYVDTRFIDVPGFCPIYVNEDLEVGKDYYYFLQGLEGSRVWFGLEETESAGTPYVSRLIYNYDELEGYNIIGEYYYSVPLRKEKVFLYDAVLALAAAVLLAAVELYVRLTKKDRLVTVGQAVRATANVVVVAAAAEALWLVSIRRFFSGQWLDNIFYTVGTLLAAATLFYMINHKRDRDSYVPLLRKWKEKAPDYLQVVFFAAAIWACCNYMNGLYDIHHRVAERQLMVFLALAALVMCKKEDIWNKFTVLYGIIAAGITMRYCSIYVDVLAMDEWDMRILRWGIAVLILGGLLMVSLLLQLVRRRKMSRISLWYGAVIGVFFILLIVFRNTRWWTVAMVVAFTLFYIRYALWDKKAHLLQNICNGLLLNFICSMFFCFVRRPFLSWIYPRYPFVFHTVTVTAVYMAVIMCAALIRLVERYLEYRKTEGKNVFVFQKNVFAFLWKELLFFGLSSTYMLFTASRTGFLAVALMMAVVFVLIAADMERQKIKSILMLIGVMAVSVVWCFPMAFTAQRILPAVCNNVYRYEVETFPDVVLRGNEWDSMYYITVRRFTEVFNNKIFDIPESGTYSYERSPEYREYLSKRFNSKGEVIWEGDIEDMNADTQAADSSGGSAENTDTAESSENKVNIIGIKTEEERAAEEAEAAQREKDAMEGNFEKVEEEEAEEEELSVYEMTEEYANGRMDIFRAYLKELNLTGHDDMGAVLPDGTLSVHAHNIYLQVAYDHGIFVGVVFLLVGAATFVQGCLYVKRVKKKKRGVPCVALPVAMLVAFAMAGLVEWIFHLCHPAGFVLMLTLAPLLFDTDAEGKTDREDLELE